MELLKVRNWLNNTGIILQDNSKHYADLIIVAMGAWAPLLVPELRPIITATGQPVIHIQLDESQFSDFSLVWLYSNSGYYGFPYNGSILKIAHHGDGFRYHPDSSCPELTSPTNLYDSNGKEILNEDARIKMKEFVQSTFPQLSNQSWMKERLCWYADSKDGDFLFDYVPDTNQSLFVCTGDSGHAFKFAPLFVDIISNALAKNSKVIRRFQWRSFDLEKKESLRNKDD